MNAKTPALSLTILAACLLAAPLAADLAPTTTGQAAAFLADMEYQVVVDGQADPDVALWSSSAMPGKLLIGERVGGAVFIRLSDKKVVPVNPAQIKVDGDRMIVNPGAYGQPLSSWT